MTEARDMTPADTDTFVGILSRRVEVLEAENRRIRDAMPKAAGEAGLYDPENLVRHWSLRELCPEEHDEAVALYGNYLFNCTPSEWNAFSPGERAVWMLRRWLAFSQATYCAYCGMEFPADCDDAQLRAHIRGCSKHPLAGVMAAARRLVGLLQDTVHPSDESVGIDLACSSVPLAQELADALTGLESLLEPPK